MELHIIPVLPPTANSIVHQLASFGRRSDDMGRDSRLHRSSGYLPPGIHRATLAEVEARFGRAPEIRRVQMESIRWMVELARRAGIARMVLNGSFVTDIMEPNDVDCALLIEPGEARDPTAESELAAGLPFMEISLVDAEGFDYLVSSFFASDRVQRPKGMIEVVP
jgi:hypothetical protein